MKNETLTTAINNNRNCVVVVVWTYLVQPHPRDEGLFLLADASNQTGIEGGRDEGGHVLGAGSSLEHFQVEGVVVAGLHRQQLSLLQAGGVLRGVVHHWKIIGWERLDGGGQDNWEDVTFRPFLVIPKSHFA